MRGSFAYHRYIWSKRRENPTGKTSHIKVFLCIVILAGVLVLLENGIYRFSTHSGKESHTKQVIGNQINEDITCFPIPLAYRSRVTYEDTYGAARAGGVHEGCDLIDRENLPGEIPVVSATSGVITNVGWLYLGGYRLGITSDSGIYYYYAHLDSYGAGIEPGKKVKAGQLLGFMGNTGEGEEGTKGNMCVHLHFGIYGKDSKGNMNAVNPYSYLVGVK